MIIKYKTLDSDKLQEIELPKCTEIIINEVSVKNRKEGVYISVEKNIVIQPQTSSKIIVTNGSK